MSLCPPCLSIPPNLFSSDRDKQCTIEHHPSFLALKESGAAGCEFCNLLLHAIQKRAEDPAFKGYIPAWSEAEAVTVRSTKFGEQKVAVGHKDVGAFRGRAVPSEWGEVPEILLSSRDSSLLTLTRKDEPTSIDLGMQDDAEMRVLNYWLQNCHQKHENCVGTDPSGFVPTRLIDVGLPDSPEVRLVLTSRADLKDPRYLALSHCWGLTMPSSATTTSATLSERLQAIPLAGLTRTFADCIDIARRLGIQHVWIDSLCIVQNSKEDWETEAAQMASVYSNAYCTVSASASADGNGGCRVDEYYQPYGPVALEWSKKDENGATTIERIRVYSSFSTPLVNVLITDPLSKRAWTLQERELSPRVLHYSKDTIRWECRSLKASTQFPWEDGLAFNRAFRAFDAGQIAPTKASVQDKAQLERNQQAWFGTVLNYTGRALTKETDRFPAISGIARAVQSVTGDTYHAGLWSSNLINCLLWASAWYDAKGLTSHTRPKSDLAPSWSWAAVSGKISYESWIFGALHPSPSPQLLPTVLEVSTTPAGSDPFGQLQSGFIRLKGRLKPAFTRGEGFANRDRETLYNPDAIQGPNNTKVGEVRFDVPAEAPAGRWQPLFCLCVQQRKESLGDTVGLALALMNTVGGKGKFKRVGLISAVKVEWWRDAMEFDFTIV
ncbi:hypothetical protein MMC30_003682 [Trapelia coarctata]|nr:hypothetical protein [Trapelia coarctata]